MTIDITPYQPVNPLDQAGKIAQLGQTMANTNLTRQQTTNAGIQGNQMSTDLNNQVLAQYARGAYSLMTLDPSQRLGQAGYDNAKRTADEVLAASTAPGGQPTPNAVNLHAQAIAQLPPPIGPDGKPTDYTPYVQQHFLAAAGSMPGADLARLIMGQQVQGTVPGGQTQFYQVPGLAAAPGTPVQPIGQPVAGGLSPEAGATRTPVIGPNRVPGTVPLSAMPGSPGVPLGGGPQAPQPGQAQPPPPGQPSPSNPPRLPGVVPKPYTGPLPQAQATLPEPAAPPGFVPTGQAPGSADVQEASAKQFAADRANAGTYNSRVQPLLEADRLLPGTSTGPGAAWVNNVRSFLSSHLAAGQTQGDIQSANFDQLNKYLTQYAANSGIAGGSDARLSTALEGNPSTHIQNMASQNVVKLLIGQERMKQAALLDFKGQPQDYADYLAQYASKNDPRAFVADLMTKDQQSAMIAGMSPQERKNFSDSYAIAKRNGLFTNTATPAVTSTAQPPPAQ